MQQRVMPLYANTHTTTSLTGLQSTCFRYCFPSQLIRHRTHHGVVGHLIVVTVVRDDRSSQFGRKTLATPRR